MRHWLAVGALASMVLAACDSGGGELQFDPAGGWPTSAASSAADVAGHRRRRAPPVTGTLRAVRRRQRRPPSRPTSPSPSTSPPRGCRSARRSSGFSSALSADELRDAGVHGEQLGRQPGDSLQLRARARLEPRRRLRVPEHELRDHRRRVAPVPRHRARTPASRVESRYRHSAGWPGTTSIRRAPSPMGMAGA